jgi:DNA-binding CsgD family transcriptional regulator
MPRSENLLTAVEAIHAAGLDPELWPEALLRVTRLFRAVGATLEDFDKRSLTLCDFKVAGLPDGAADPYVEYYARHNPRAAYAFRHLSQETLCDYQFIDERGMDRDPYYAKYLTSIDLRYFLSGQISNTPSTQAVVAIQRSPRQGHVSRADINVMQRLLPHLRQAWDVSKRLKSAERAVRSLERTLDWLADGVVLLHADGRVLYTNESFRAIARRSDGIRMHRGTVEIADPVARSHFAAAIGAANKIHTDAAEPGSTDIAVTRRSGIPPYIVSVRPLAAATRERQGSEADVIVFVHDPLQRNAATARMLRELFGLTEAEADLARALQSGVTLGEYALARVVSLNTVYTHLRHIKEKTRCRRMHELIRKLNDLQVWLRVE